LEREQFIDTVFLKARLLHGSQRRPTFSELCLGLANKALYSSSGNVLDETLCQVNFFYPGRYC
jgi:hypothetical protein